MKNLARFSSLAAALCLGIPATGFSHDHHDSHGSWSGGHSGHGGYYCGPRYGHYRSFPYFAAYPYYAAPYYGAAYYDDGYYDSPSFGVSIAPSSTAYRGTQVDDRADGLTIDVQRALRRDGYYRGSIDGDIGAGTRAAIRQYNQYDHHLEVTGRIDRSLLRSLDLD